MGSFKKFVGELLAQPADYRISSFALILQPTELGPSHYSLLNDCLRDVLKRGVLVLELNINVKGGYYPLPLEVFTCETVVKMKLGSGSVIDIVPMNALLPALKTLLLDSVWFYDLGGCAFTRLLSACPVLEALVIDGFDLEDWKWSCIVSSSTLKRLTIRRSKRSRIVSGPKTLSFDTPNLVYLEYSDVLQHAYPVVNLNSLVEAKLNLPMNVRDEKGLTNLIKGLKNVQILHLDFVDTALLFHDLREVLPEFENMSHLSIQTEIDVCWKALQVLLKKSPKLKSLTIVDLHCPSLGSVCECLLGYSFLSSCRIEVLKIIQFSGDIGEMVQIKHILDKMQYLKLLEIHVQERRDVEKKIQIMFDLLMFPRGSSKCKVKVNFS